MLLYACGGLFIALPSNADSLGRTDKLRVLYSSQFSFDSRGVPLITIGIIEGTDQVTLSSGAALRVLPDGGDGAEVTGRSRWLVQLKSSKPAVLEHYVVVARASPSDVHGVRASIKKWRKRGLASRLVELGAVYGMGGQVFDTRTIALCEGPFTTPAAARARAEQHLKRGWVSKVETLMQLKKRPSGVIEATDVETKTRIRAKDAIWFAAQSPRHLLSVKSARNRSGHFTGQLGGKYRGSLYVTIDRRGKLAVVNALPADQLLYGLVSAEIFPSAPAAALRAQAVAARGNVLAKIGTQNLADPYLTCAWSRCQVYRGAGHEHPRTTAAVKATKGLVLMREGRDEIVDAVYSAHSGGFTENNDNVWPGPPDPALRGKLDAPSTRGLTAFSHGINEQNIERWLSTAPDTWSARAGVNRDKLRWNTRIPVADLARTLRHRKLGQITGIEVLERGRSGRAKLVRVRGSRGSNTIRGELTIRRAFGNLRSSMFVVRPVVDGQGRVSAFRFIGGGWGHGVGMCQTGAIGMAKAQKTFKQILTHYYSQAEVRRIY